MATISKTDLLKVVEEAIPTYVSTRSLILTALDGMIPDEKDQVFIDERSNSRVRRAFKLYRKFHPEYGNMEPELHDVISWLLTRSGISQVMQIETRMIQLTDILSKVGNIDPDQMVALPGLDILRMRVMATPLIGQDDEEEEVEE